MRQLFSLILLLVFVIGHASCAQGEDLFPEFRAAHQEFLQLLTGEGKDIEFRYLLEPKSASETGDGKFSLQDTLFSAELPIPLTRDFFLRFSAEYEARFYHFSNVRILGAEPGDVTLHRIPFGIGFGQFFDDEWLLTGKFSPAIVSDLEDGLNHDQMQYFGQLILVRQYQENLQLVAGAVSDRLFQGTEVYPVAALRFRTADRRWHVKLTPPIDARIGYSLNSSDQLYLKFWQTGDRYRVFFEEPGLSFDLRVEDRRIGFGFLHWIDDHLNLSIEFGTAIMSRFKFDLESPDLPDEDASPAMYSFLSMGYAL